MDAGYPGPDEQANRIERYDFACSSDPHQQRAGRPGRQRQGV